MQTPKTRGSPKESPQKVSVRPARQLKINSVEPNSSSPSSNATAKTPNRSPKVTERRSPRSPIIEKKRPSKLSELESQVSKLQDDLKKVKDQLVSSESVKREVQKDAEEAKRQLADVSSKLEESQKQLSQLLAAKEENIVDLQNISEEKEQEWESQIKCIRKQHSVDSAALASALDEIERLKQHLENVTESGDIQVKQSEIAYAEFQSLKDNFTETLSVLESMKQELKESRVSEAQAQELVRETLLQLEAAKETVNALRSDVNRSAEAYNSVASELEQSRARVFFLEGVVKGLNADLMKLSSVNSLETSEDQILPEDVNQLQRELQAAKSDVRQFKSALEAAEIRYNEERFHSSTQIGNATELLEQVKAHSSRREAELEVELRNASANIQELKANLMDKETELQGISDENDSLHLKLEESSACQRKQEVENELKKLREHVAVLRANLMDKETELQSISRENELLKLEISKQEMNKSVENDQVAAEVAAEVDASRAAEQDAVTKLGYMMEEVDKSNRKAARVVEQLEAAQAANAEMEAELRRLKVQSDQWRKAAEAAASMLSPGSNGKYVERTGSLPLDSKYSPVRGRHSSPYLDDYDDDSFKKKNGNVLKKIGVLWKKPQK